MDYEEALEILNSSLFETASFSCFIDLPILYPNVVCEQPDSATCKRLGESLEKVYAFAIMEGLLQPDALEDTSGVNMLFFYIPFLLASITASLPVERLEDGGIDRCSRVAALEYSKMRFLEHCRRLVRGGLACDGPSEDSLIAIEKDEKVDPGAKRTRKIARCKLMMELDAKAKALDVNFGNSKVPLTEESYERRVNVLDADEFQRTVLESSVLHSLDQISIVGEEIEILKFMIKRDQESGGVEPSALPPRKPQPMYSILPGGRMVEGHVVDTDIVDLKTGRAQQRIVNRVGITKDPEKLLGGKLQTRNLIANDVFKPFYTLPTISLAECGDWEMALETGPNMSSINSKLRVDEDGNEYLAKSAWEGNVEDIGQKTDEESEDSDQTREKREWDDWCDLNPKGSGNKMVNIG